MQGSRKALGFVILGLTFLLVACSATSTYTGYERDIVTGKQLLREGDYPQARDDFLKASGTERRPEALALAATATYKLNDLQATAQYLAEAERAGRPGTSYFRISGYKALTLLKEGKKQEGLKVLGNYIQDYKQAFDSDTLPQVEYMWKKGTVDLPRLERLIDQQVTEYENAMDWFSKTHTGPFNKSGTVNSK
jgi:tetratricopeptide (TPR) repeat protein